MSEKWKPLLKIELMDIINDSGFKDFHVGSPESLIFEVMGVPELPATKISKKSKIFSHLYGNVNILSENGTVIAINIDFHSNRTEMVTVGEIGCWGIDDWMQLVEKKGWITTKIGDVIQIIGNGMIIGLSQEGEVGVVSLR